MIPENFEEIFLNENISYNWYYACNNCKKVIVTKTKSYHYCEKCRLQICLVGGTCQ